MSKLTSALSLAAALSLAGGLLMAPAVADDAVYNAALNDAEQTFGFVPGFLKAMPKAALPGAWKELKDLEFSENTALSPKVKSLIGLAVVAQIPCAYCIWADAASARQAGASEEEIREAVAIAATERYWSTMLNGLEINLDEFKAEFGPVLGVTATAK